MATKIYVVPISRLSLEDLRKAFKKAKQDARGNSEKDVQQMSKDETSK